MLLACLLCNLLDMCGACSAAAAHNLRPSAKPLRGLLSKACRIAIASPATVCGIPFLSGIRINHDGFVCRRAQFANQFQQQRRRRAVDANSNGLREARNRDCAIASCSPWITCCPSRQVGLPDLLYQWIVSVARLPGYNSLHIATYETLI